MIYHLLFLIKIGSIGGITGKNYGTIQYCTNKTNISGKCQVSALKLFAGGIAAINRKNIEFCKNEGDVFGEGATGWQTQIGGITGFNNCSVTSCYNKGKVSGKGSGSNLPSPTFKQQVMIGGIVGMNYIDNEGILIVEKCYNEGEISGENGYYTHAGGIVGENGSYGNINKCCNVSHVKATGSEGGTVAISAGICGLTEKDNTTIKECYYFNQYINNGVGYGEYEEEEIIGVDNINDIPSVKEITGHDF